MDHVAPVENQARPTVILPGLGARSLSIQGLLLVSASFLLPAAAHLAGLPVRVMLPMHWPVILVGLCYGWRSGVLVGLAAPGLSFVLSGMPYPPILPAMTVELATYGLLAGFFRGHLRWNAAASTALAIIGGRVVFVSLALATGTTGGVLLPYLEAAILPGLASGLAQIILLPLAATWWVARESRR